MTDKMGKNFGILTFWQSPDNYGQILQAFALQKFLKKNEIDSFLVRFDHNGTLETFSPNSADAAKKTLNALRDFDGFREKFLKKSEVLYRSFEQLRDNLPDADGFIVGSDQVWNLDWTLGASLKWLNAYFLDFAGNAKKLSYAASFSVSEISEKYQKLAWLLLGKFDYVSVREESGLDICKTLNRPDAHWRPDPTMLLDAADYREVYKDENFEKIGEPFLFCYMLANENDFDIQAARNFAKKRGLRFVLVTGNDAIGKYGEGETFATIPQFLWLIDNAKYVITNSFHGAVLSTIFETKYGAIPLSEGWAAMNLRVDSLFERFKIAPRWYRKNNLSVLDKDFSPSEVEIPRDFLAALSANLPHLAPKENCTGCSACAEVCPKNAIKMQADGFGFLFPKIDAEKCTDCGLCQKSCPVLQNFGGCDIQKVFAAQSEKFAQKSSSGGVFGVLSENFLAEGGSVFGTAFSRDFSECEIVEIAKIEDLPKIQGSKYLQSKIGEAFSKCAENLQSGKKVLFSGTPCQIAGLKAFLCAKNANDEGLFCVEVLCHGAPAPEVWQKYLQKISQNAEIADVSFRRKSPNFKWETYGLCVTSSRKDRKVVYEKCHREDLFFAHFLNDLCLRESCGNCRFRRKNSQADITLGDFWGVPPEIRAKFANADAGISVVLTRTKKGESFFAAVRKNLQTAESDFWSAANGNPVINRPVDLHPLRNEYRCDFLRLSFDEFCKKWDGDFCKYVSVEARLDKYKEQIRLQNEKISMCDAEIQQKNCEITQKNEELSAKDAEIQQKSAEIDAIKSGLSFRIGRKVTWLPRKIRGTMRWLKTRGLVATIRHAGGYVLRKFGAIK